MSRFTNPIPQYDNNTGDLLAGGKLYFYKSGTNTLISIYSNDDETTLIANPVILDAAGRVPNIFYTGTARCVLTDSNDVQIWDVDPVGGENQFGNFSGWNNDTTYNINEFVVGSDGKFYRSLQSGNQGNDPISSPQNNTFWEEVRFRNIWNSSITYQLNDFVQDGDRFYLSKISNNLGNDPSAGTGVNWVDFGDATRLPYDNTISGLTSVNVKSAIDEIKNLIDNLPSSVVYRGQLDVSAGDSALPASPTNGDLYFISVGGTITVSTAGGTPTPTAVNVGDQIIYNGTLSQWDLSEAVDQAISISYDNTTSGLSSTNVQTAIDELKTLDDNINAILGTVTASEMAQVANINSLVIDNTKWSWVANQDQATSSTSAVTFATVNTGQGDNELYAMNQDVRSTDSVTFADATFGGPVSIQNSDATTELTFAGSEFTNITSQSTSGMQFGTTGSTPVTLITAGTTALTLDATQNATFSGDVSLTNNGVTTELTSLTFDSTGGAIDAAITQQANTGVLSIESGRNASWNGSIQLVTDTVTALTIDGSQDATFSGDAYLSSGRFGVGTTNPAAFGRAAIQSASETTLALNDTTDVADLAFFENGAGRGAIKTLSGSDGLLFTYGLSTEAFRYDSSGATFSGHLLPGTDNANDLGSASLRMAELFAANGTINTSDITLKTDFEALTDIEKEAFRASALLIGTYKWLDAVEAKGDAARIHIGVPAQTIMAEFTSRGLEPTDYACFCIDDIHTFDTELVPEMVQETETKTRDKVEIVIVDGVPTQKVTQEEYESPLVNMVGLVDENDNPVIQLVESGELDENQQPIMVEQQVMYPVPVMVEKQVEKKVKKPAGKRYGVRYNELFAGIIASM